MMTEQSTASVDLTSEEISLVETVLKMDKAATLYARIGFGLFIVAMGFFQIPGFWRQVVSALTLALIWFGIGCLLTSKRTELELRCKREFAIDITKLIERYRAWKNPFVELNYEGRGGQGTTPLPGIQRPESPPGPPLKTNATHAD